MLHGGKYLQTSPALLSRLTECRATRQSSDDFQSCRALTKLIRRKCEISRCASGPLIDTRRTHFPNRLTLNTIAILNQMTLQYEFENWNRPFDSADHEPHAVTKAKVN